MQPHILATPTGLARAYLLVPGQAPRLLPDKLADGGGLSPQTSYEEVLPVFKTGHRYAMLHHPKNGYPGENRTRSSSFAGKRSGSAELRDSWWRITVARQLFTDLAPHGRGSRSCTGKARRMRPDGGCRFPQLKWSRFPDTLRTTRFTGPR